MFLFQSKDKLFVIGQYKAEIEGHTYEGNTLLYIWFIETL